jgi:hypothetical protein
MNGKKEEYKIVICISLIWDWIKLGFDKSRLILFMIMVLAGLSEKF